MNLGTIESIVKNIKSVELGNINNPSASRKVIAFTVEENGRNVKLILKGKQAEVVYDKFLKDKKSMHSTKMIDGVEIDKEVYVSFRANIKEVRGNEVICHEPSSLIFGFHYAIV